MTSFFLCGIIYKQACDSAKHGRSPTKKLYAKEKSQMLEILINPPDDSDEIENTNAVSPDNDSGELAVAIEDPEVIENYTASDNGNDPPKVDIDDSDKEKAYYTIEIKLSDTDNIAADDSVRSDNVAASGCCDNDINLSDSECYYPCYTEEDWLADHYCNSFIKDDYEKNFHLNNARLVRESEESKAADLFWADTCRINSAQTDELSEDLFDCFESEYEDCENQHSLEDSIFSDLLRDDLFKQKKNSKKKDKKKHKKKLKKIQKMQKNAELFAQNHWRRPFEQTGEVYKSKCEERSAEISEEKKLKPYSMYRRIVENFNVIVVDGSCYIHDGIIYKHYNTDAIETFLKTILSEDEQYLLNSRNYEDAVKQLLHEPSVICENPPYPKGIVAFENGLFDLSTGEKIDHPENYFLTYKIRSKYNPEKKIKTPVFDKFIDDISGGDPQIKDRIMYMIAYSILPGNMGKCFFVCGTAPDSGKSVLANLIADFFDKKNVSHVALHDFSKHFELAPLQNSVLNCHMDEDASIISKTAISKLKSLTGNDGTELAIKHITSIAYYNQAKFIFGTNHIILLEQADAAFWNRLIFVPFLHSTDKKHQNTQLLDMLKAEKEGIIQNAVKYARVLIKNDYKFPPCHVAEKVVDSWRYGRISSIYTFVRNCCKITDNKKNGTHSAELFEAYDYFCEEIGVEGVNQNMFSRTLTDIFKLPHEKWDGKWGYRGIFLK